MRCSQEGFAVRRLCRAHSYPPTRLSHRFGKTPSPARSPTDALIDLKVRCRLRRQVPICWFDLRPVIRLRIAVIPHRWPARRADVRGLGVDPNVIKDLPDLCALGNERLALFFSEFDIEHFDAYRKSHRKINIAFRDVMFKAFCNEYNAN